LSSYKELYSDAVEAERWNLLHPEQPPRVPYIQSLLAGKKGSFVAASDYMKVLSASISQWFPGPLHCLGTDGFGRSDDRAHLRDFFEVDARYIVLAALKQQVEAGALNKPILVKALTDLDIQADKLNPHVD